MTNSDWHRLNWTCRQVNQRGRQRRIYCHTYSTTLKKLDPYRHLSFFNILHTLPRWSCAVHAREASSATGLNNVLRMSVTSLVYLSSPCAKHSGKVKFLQDHFIFDHPNSYLRMPTKEKFYEYVRNATHWVRSFR